jgi:hypothetical protein
MPMDARVLERLEWYAAAHPSRLVLADVPLAGPAGGWGEVPDHRIDGVVVHGADTAGLLEAPDPDEVAQLVVDRPVTLVVARGYYDRPLLGLLLGGGDIFARSYPRHGRLSWLAITDKTEANIGWVYRKNGIELAVRDA